MNSKVFNVNIQELIETLTDLGKEFKYADFEIETTDLVPSGTKLIIYPVTYKPKIVPSPNIKIDPSKDIDDLIKDLT